MTNTTIDPAAERAAYLRAQERNRSAIRGLVFGLPLSVGLFWIPLIWAVTTGNELAFLAYVSGLGVGLWLLARERKGSQR